MEILFPLNRFFWLTLTVIFCLWAHNTAAQIYQWVDENGRLHFTDKPPAPKSSPPGDTTPEGTDRDNPEQPAPTSLSHTKPILDTKASAYPDSLVLSVRKRLKEKKFEELNQILENYQNASESRISEEDTLFTAYRAFDIKDKSFETVFNAWIEKTPRRYPPYLARGTFYFRMGWEARGGKWARETQKEQFDAMNGYFDRAIRDLNAAIGINNQSMIPYCRLIGIANARGEEDQEVSITGNALMINAASYKVREAFLNAITPRWGGSYKLMHAFANESLKYVSQNPKLQWLKGYPYLDDAEMRILTHKYIDAVELCSQALTFGDNHLAFSIRGEAYLRRKQYPEALKDFNRAIELYPEDGEHYYWRSMAHTYLHQYDEAKADIERAEELSPGDERIESHRNHLASATSQFN